MSSLEISKPISINKASHTISPLNSPSISPSPSLVQLSEDSNSHEQTIPTHHFFLSQINRNKPLAPKISIPSRVPPTFSTHSPSSSPPNSPHPPSNPYAPFHISNKEDSSKRKEKPNFKSVREEDKDRGSRSGSRIYRKGKEKEELEKDFGTPGGEKIEKEETKETELSLKELIHRLLEIERGPEKKKKGRGGWTEKLDITSGKQLKRVSFCQSIASLLRSIHEVRAKTLSTQNWASVFSYRMIEIQDITSQEEIQSLEKSLNLFLSLSPEYLKPEDTLSTSIATSLLSYLQSHTIDPDNTLVGMHPAKSVIDKFFHEGNTSGSSTPTPLSQIPSVSAPVLSSSPGNISQAISTSSSSLVSLDGQKKTVTISNSKEDPLVVGELVIADMSCTYTSIVQINQSHPSATTPLNLSSHSNNMGSSLQGATSHPFPSLTIHNPLKKYMFVRVMSVVEDKIVEISSKRNESKCCFIFKSNLIRLSPEFFLSLKSVRSMESVTDNIGKSFFHSLNTYISDQTLLFLENNYNIDSSFLLLVKNNQVTLSNLTKLKKTISSLKNLFQNSQNEPWFKYFELTVRDKIDKFILEVDEESLFPATRNSTLSQLNTCHTAYSSLPLVLIKQHIGNCEASLDQLSLEQRSLMNGNLKNELTNWWLDFINNSVETFLKSKGIDFSAVPIEYITVAPNSMEQVYTNLEILQHHLKSLRSEEEHEIHQLIDSIKTKVYEKIDQFMFDAKQVLCDFFEIEYNHDQILNLVYTNEDESSDTKSIQTETDEEKDKDPQNSLSKGKGFTDRLLDQISEIYEQKKESLDSTISSWIGEMIKDIDYLNEMKFLEENPVTGKLVLGVVPVTGIIVGKMYRLENEYLTVIDVWGGAFKKLQQQQQQQQQTQQQQQNQQQPQAPIPKKDVPKNHPHQEDSPPTTPSPLVPEDSNSSSVWNTQKGSRIDPRAHLGLQREPTFLSHGKQDIGQSETSHSTESNETNKARVVPRTPIRPLPTPTDNRGLSPRAHSRPRHDNSLMSSSPSAGISQPHNHSSTTHHLKTSTPNQDFKKESPRAQIARSADLSGSNTTNNESETHSNWSQQGNKTSPRLNAHRAQAPPPTRIPQNSHLQNVQKSTGRHLSLDMNSAPPTRRRNILEKTNESQPQESTLESHGEDSDTIFNTLGSLESEENISKPKRVGRGRLNENRGITIRPDSVETQQQVIESLARQEHALQLSRLRNSRKTITDIHRHLQNMSIYNAEQSWSSRQPTGEVKVNDLDTQNDPDRLPSVVRFGTQPLKK